VNPKKKRWIAPGPGGELTVTGKVGKPVYNPVFGPAKSRIVRGPDGKLVAIPIPPPDAVPPSDPPAAGS
jgi:hypothetical protein